MRILWGLSAQIRIDPRHPRSLLFLQTVIKADGVENKRAGGCPTLLVRLKIMLSLEEILSVRIMAF